MRGRLAGLVAAGVDLTDGVPTLGPRPWRVVAGVHAGPGLRGQVVGAVVLRRLRDHVDDLGSRRAEVGRRARQLAQRRPPLVDLRARLVPGRADHQLPAQLAGLVRRRELLEPALGRHPPQLRTLNLLRAVRIPFNWGFLPNGIRSLGDYTYRAYQFHESLDSFHPYRSNPWSWLILGRPITYYYPSNVQGCGSSSCSREVLLIGTPLMWWAFVPALIWLVWHWFTTRDWRASMVWLAMAAGWLVWFQDPKRTMFLFYMTPLVPFLILGVTLALGVMLGPAVGTVTRAGGTVVRVDQPSSGAGSASPASRSTSAWSSSTSPGCGRSSPAASSPTTSGTPTCGSPRGCDLGVTPARRRATGRRSSIRGAGGPSAPAWSPLFHDRARRAASSSSRCPRSGAAPARSPAAAAMGRLRLRPRLRVVPIIAGRLGDDRGRKQMLLVGVGRLHRHAARSSGSPPNANVLLVTRVVQGLSAGAAEPAGLGHRAEPVPAARAGAGVLAHRGAWSASGPRPGRSSAASSSTSAAPHFGWRLTFLINVPVGITSLS